MTHNKFIQWPTVKALSMTLNVAIVVGLTSLAAILAIDLVIPFVTQFFAD